MEYNITDIMTPTLGKTGKNRISGNSMDLAVTTKSDMLLEQEGNVNLIDDLTGPGVYALFYKDKLRYVGKHSCSGETDLVMSRWKKHIQGLTFRGDTNVNSMKGYETVVNALTNDVNESADNKKKHIIAKQNLANFIARKETVGKNVQRTNTYSTILSARNAHNFIDKSADDIFNDFEFHYMKIDAELNSDQLEAIEYKLIESTQPEHNSSLQGGPRPGEARYLTQAEYYDEVDDIVIHDVKHSIFQ